MKVLSINSLKKVLGVTVAAGTITVATPSVKAQSDSTLQKDTFISTIQIPPKGTTKDSVLLCAPSPEIYILSEKKNAAIIVDLSKNVLYKYNEEGKAECAYLVASGKKKSPTDPGLRIVTHVEKYPYKSAPTSTKRRNKPWDYGPRIICLDKIDPETGIRSRTGEFIHGNNDPNSIGKYSSLGCIRMDNAVIKELATQVKKGDLVLIKENKNL